MLRKISLSFLVLPFLLVAYAPVFSQGLEFSGKVRVHGSFETSRIYASDDSTTNISDTVINNTTSVGFGYVGSLGGSYSVAIPSDSDLTAGVKLGLEIEGDDSHLGFTNRNALGVSPVTTANLDYAVYIAGERTTVSFGYLEGVSFPISTFGPEKTETTRSDTANDEGDLIGRQNALAVSTNIQALTLNLAGGLATKAAVLPNGPLVLPGNNPLFGYSPFIIKIGSSVNYKDFGLDIGFGATFTEHSFTTNVIVGKVNVLKFAAGVGYDLSAAVSGIGAPKVWFAFVNQNTIDASMQLLSVSNLGYTPYNAFGFGVDYSYDSFNAGFSGDFVLYNPINSTSAAAAAAATSSTLNPDPKTGTKTIFLVWANYQMAPQTKLFTSLGFYNADKLSDNFANAAASGLLEYADISAKKANQFSLALGAKQDF